MKIKTCKAKTKSGAPCGMAPLAGGSYCYTHEPTKARVRALAHKTGGARNRVDHAGNADQIPKAARTINDALVILDYTLAESIPLENSIARGRLLISLVAGYIDALKVGEMEARILALETIMKAR